MKDKDYRFNSDENMTDVNASTQPDSAQSEQYYDVEQVSEEDTSLSTDTNDTGSISLRDRRKMVKKEKKNREKLIKEQKSVKPVNSKPDDKSDEDSKSTDNAENKKAKVISFNSKKDTADKKDNKKTPEHKSISDKLNKQKKKKIFLAIFILIFLVLAVVLYANRDFLTFSNISNWVQYDLFGDNSEETFPVSTGGDVITDGNFSRIDKNLVFASDTKFMTLNNYGKTIYSASQSFATPVLSQASDSDLSIVYNLGGKEFNIYNLDSTVYNGETEDSILVADISSSGVYALVTAKEGYHSKLYVYSEDNALIYAYSFADYYITSVSLDSDGETAVLSGISTHDSSQLSSVYLLDFTLEEPVFFEEIYENVLYHTAHLNDDYIAIIGENASYVLDADSSELKTTNYDGKTLTAFDINTETETYTLSLSRSGDGRMCDIFTFTTDGVLDNVISTDLMIKSLSTYKDAVAALSTNIVYLYSKDGDLESETKVGLEPHCVVLYSTSDAYVLGLSEIRRYDL